MIGRKVFFVFQQGIKKLRSLKRRVDGFIDHLGSALHAHPAKSQIIIPWQDIQLSIIFIQIIIVRHVPRKAVHIHREGMYRHIF